MTYTKTIWRDQLVERPKTYEFSNNQDGSVTLIESFGNVTELGTPVNATNMNHIENGLADTDVTKYNVNTTYSTGEWVTGVVNSVKGVYVSKADNNTGNALTNTTYWEEVDLSPNKAKIDFSNVNDTATSKGASWAMPSNTKESVTIGASGTSYSAPSNGYFLFGALASATGDTILGLINNTSAIGSTIIRSISGNTRRVFVPAKKGDSVEITYTGTNSAISLFFIYAVGSESEASS